MTDNDDPAPPRDVHASRDRDDEESREVSTRRATDRAQPPIRRSVGATHVAPTDPEVPSAKRRGAFRRQRSLILLTVVVAGLLSITFSLLYRAGRRVGAPDENSGVTSLTGDARFDTVAAPASLNPGRTLTGLGPPPSGSEVDDEAREDSASSDSAPLGSAPATKNPPPALDIIRTPAF